MSYKKFINTMFTRDTRKWLIDNDIVIKRILDHENKKLKQEKQDIINEVLVFLKEVKCDDNCKDNCLYAEASHLIKKLQTIKGE